jgi:hypothetical protein
MVKWEYLVVERKRKLGIGDLLKAGAEEWNIDIYGSLDKLGEDGWQLSNIAPRAERKDFPGVTTCEAWIFKRPKNT